MPRTTSSEPTTPKTPPGGSIQERLARMQMSSQKADEKPEASPKTTGGIRARLAKLGGGIPMPGLGGAPRPPPMPSSKPVEETKDGIMKHDTLKRASGPRRRRTAKVAKFTSDKAVVEAVEDAPPPAPSGGSPPPMPPPAA
jgi:hypothetical protein